jgi:uncharacterized protein YkwD
MDYTIGVIRLTKTLMSSPSDGFICLSGRLALFAALSVACVPPSQVQSASTTTTSTASPTPTADYRELEREVAAELNAVRANPAGYSRYLSELLPTFNGMTRRRFDGVLVRTQEGAAAVREAITALQRQPAVPQLTSSSAMSNAARDLAEDQRRTGTVGHAGSDGSNPGTRLARYGTWGTTYNENVDYGAFRSGREVVVDLIVDDGVADRGHRRNIFDPNVRVVGVACGAHPRYGSVCVIDQAASYVPRSDRRFQN